MNTSLSSPSIQSTLLTPLPLSTIRWRRFLVRVWMHFTTILTWWHSRRCFPPVEMARRTACETSKLEPVSSIGVDYFTRTPKFHSAWATCFTVFRHRKSVICVSVGHMLQTVSGRILTAKDFLARLVSRDGEVQLKMFSLLANLRGCTEHFSKLGMDMRRMVKNLGPATISITCSTAKWFSYTLLSHITSKASIKTCTEYLLHDTRTELCPAEVKQVAGLQHSHHNTTYYLN